jgi:hypothetical protein
MPGQQRQFWWKILFGALLLAAGLRDIFLPGFLSISSIREPGNVEVVLGSLFIAIAIFRARRAVA